MVIVCFAAPTKRNVKIVAIIRHVPAVSTFVIGTAGNAAGHAHGASSSTAVQVDGSRNATTSCSKDVVATNAHAVGNTAVGNNAVGNNDFGNTAVGNTAVGNNAVGNNDFGNTAVGNTAVGNNDFGNNNVVCGSTLLVVFVASAISGQEVGVADRSRIGSWNRRMRIFFAFGKPAARLIQKVSRNNDSQPIRERDVDVTGADNINGSSHASTVCLHLHNLA